MKEEPLSPPKKPNSSETSTSDMRSWSAGPLVSNTSLSQQSSSGGKRLGLSVT